MYIAKLRNGESKYFTTLTEAKLWCRKREKLKKLRWRERKHIRKNTQYWYITSKGNILAAIHDQASDTKMPSFREMFGI